MALIKLPNTGKLQIFKVSTETEMELTNIGNISAGFPSPALDFIETSIDLNRHVIKNPHTTFYAIASGNSMNDAGICDRDLLVIDKSIEPANGRIAVCIINGDFILKTLKVDKTGVWLVPANPDYKPIKVTEFHDFEIWGIVTHTIKRLYPCSP